MGEYGTPESLTDPLDDAQISLPTAISSFIAIAWYNVLVINVVILLVFRRWSGLYFYSLLVASWGIFFHQLGFMLQFFALVPGVAEWFVLVQVGWYSMTTGQAVVLYSRIHLLVRDSRRYRWVIYMIGINAILFHIPTTAFMAMTHVNIHLVPDYHIWQNIQVTAFSIQEFILAGLYIYEARQLLNPITGFRRGRVQTVMRNLIFVNVLVIVLDIAVMCIQYVGLFEVHVVLKGAAYSVKLFVEFFVLNQLTEVARAGVQTAGGCSRGIQYIGADRAAPPMAPNHIADDRLTRENVQSQRYPSFTASRAVSPPDPSHKGHVYRMTEVIITSERGSNAAQLTNSSQPGERNEQRRSGAPIRRMDDWIELN